MTLGKPHVNVQCCSCLKMLLQYNECDNRDGDYCSAVR